MYSLPFIPHSQVEPLQALLTRGSRLRAFVPIVAHSGAGARRIVLEWVRNHAPCEHSQIVWTRMTQPGKPRRSKESMASNSALLLFENAFDFLTKLRTRADVWETLLTEEPTRQFDDTRFVSLKNKVIGLMRKQGVRLWIISNAQALSTNALGFVFEAWEACDRAFAVVLLGKLARDQECNDVWSASINPEGELGAYSLRRHELYRIDQQIAHLPFMIPGFPESLVTPNQLDSEEVKAIDEAWSKSEYLTKVLLATLEALDADVGADLNQIQFTQRAWHHAQGNWDHITMFATVLNDELASAARKPRLITQAVADRVFQILLPKRPTTGTRICRPKRGARWCGRRRSPGWQHDCGTQ